jgi:hypothetical protein
MNQDAPFGLAPMEPCLDFQRRAHDASWLKIKMKQRSTEASSVGAIL